MHRIQRKARQNASPDDQGFPSSGFPGVKIQTGIQWECLDLVCCFPRGFVQRNLGKICLLSSLNNYLKGTILIFEMQTMVNNVAQCIVLLLHFVQHSFIADP